MDFYRYVLDPKRVGVPLDIKRVFGGVERTLVEIGFGNGHFLIELSKQHPCAAIIGIEVSLTSMVKAGKLLARNGVKNVRLIKGDAKLVFSGVFKGESLDGVYINFPCPWPKKSHGKRRFFRDELFLRSVCACLKMGGLLSLVTDEGWYALEAKEALEKAGFSVKGFGEICEEPKTKYWKKWTEMGKSIYRVVAEKIQEVKMKWVVEGVGMPHVKVSKVDFGKLLELEGRVFKGERWVFKVEEVFCDGKKAAVRVIAVDEGRISQVFFVDIAPREEGYIVKLDHATEPYRTEAVKQAVWKIAKTIGGDCL